MNSNRRGYPEPVLPGLLLLALAGSAWGQSVHYVDARLSVDFRTVPIVQALEQVAAQTDLQFDIQPGVEGVLNVRFEDQPLAPAIRRLLEGYNFMLLYGSGEEGGRRPVRVMVMNRVDATAAAVTPETVAKTPDPSPVQVILQRRGNGPYAAPGRINGQPVQFLVDTGATTVTLSAALARRLGLGRGTTRHIDTASGRTTGYETSLRQLELGDLRLEDVRAIVLPGMTMDDRVLLGMNVLEGLELIQRDGSLILRQPR